MRYANVGGLRREAARGLKGTCIGCGNQMVAKCGTVRVDHWAHRSLLVCDHWWENETDWHRGWKDHFPKDWQESPCRSEVGEWHFADVKTSEGWVLEFQNSPISVEERVSRNLFYGKIIWIVNGTRLVRDKKVFFKTVEAPFGSRTPSCFPRTKSNLS